MVLCDGKIITSYVFRFFEPLLFCTYSDIINIGLCWLFLFHWLSSAAELNLHRSRCPHLHFARLQKPLFMKQKYLSNLNKIVRSYYFTITILMLCGIFREELI